MSTITTDEGYTISIKGYNSMYDALRDDDSVNYANHNRKKRCKIFLNIVVGLLFTLYLVAVSFLVYEHFNYPGTPSEKVRLWRDICAIYSMIVMGLTAIFGGIYFWKKERSVLLLLTVLYILTSAFWGFYHWFYTLHSRHVPKGVYITKMGAMIYSISFTVSLIMIACANSPDDCLMVALCCMFAE